MQVVKRNGQKEEFDIKKVDNAVEKAFASVGKKLSNALYSKLNRAVLSSIGDKEEVSIEKIQDAVERHLMLHYPEVAKSYILYREKHDESRLIKDKIEYIVKYSQSQENAATNSNTDANANNSMKNVASIEAEVFKDKNRLIQRQMMKDRLNALFPEVAQQYERDLKHHIIYCHDESSSPIQKAYCGAYTLYPLMTEGVGNVDGITPTPPNDLQSFSGQVTNLVFSLSAQTKGAVALGDYMVALNYYAVKEFGNDYYSKLDSNICNSNVVDWQKFTIRREIKKAFKQFIYGVNQPQGNRGYQSPFTNINIFDKYYFNALFGDFYYPDGTQPQWEAIDKLQRIFIQLLIDIRLIKPCTFPVVTFALLYDDNGYKDKEYADFCAEMWAKGSSHFLYHSDNADSLSSCCFSKDTKVLWKSSTKGVMLTTLEELHNTSWTNNKENLRIFHNGSWVSGRSIKLPNRRMFKVVLENNKEYIMTDNHINITLSGEKITEDLTGDDYLMFNTFKLNTIPEKDEHLTYAQGFIIGAFLGDGSFGSSVKNVIYDTIISSNENKVEKSIDMFKIGLAGLNIKADIKIRQKEVKAALDMHICSKELSAFIIKWTCWERGTYAYNKKLNLNCLLQSTEFRHGILDGWYNTDGGNSNRCYTTSKELMEDMEVLITSLGMQSIINVSDKTDESVIIHNKEYKRNYPLYCVRWYSETNHRNNRDINKAWIKKNNSIYFKVKSIAPVEYKDDVYCIECKDTNEPYFTLPSGLITHNCRVSNKIDKNTFSSTTGMTGVMTGSCNVITLNINRIVQDFCKQQSSDWKKHKGELARYLEEILERVYKYHIVYKSMLYDLEKEHMITYSDANYLYIKKLFSTIGVLGYYEAAKFLKLEDNSTEYNDFMAFILSTISKSNKEHSIYDSKKPFVFNLEAVPGESLGVKLYNWDKKDGYVVPEDQNLYNCYFFNPWKEENILNKIKAHGGAISEASDGGQGCHINLSEHLSKEQYLKVMDIARVEKCNYFTFNIPMSECNDCHHVVNGPISECPECHSHNISYWTRIIGFLTKVNNWSKERQIEFNHRFYGKD